jgi:hypothetical protein
MEFTTASISTSGRIPSEIAGQESRAQTPVWGRPQPPTGSKIQSIPFSRGESKMTFKPGNPGGRARKADKQLPEVSVNDPDFKAFMQQYDWSGFCQNQCPDRNKEICRGCPGKPTPASNESPSADT